MATKIDELPAALLLATLGEQARKEFGADKVELNEDSDRTELKLVFER